MIVVDVCSMVIVHNIVVTKMGVLRAQFSICAHATILTQRPISRHRDGATDAPIIDCTRSPKLLQQYINAMPITVPRRLLKLVQRYFLK